MTLTSDKRAAMRPGMILAVAVLRNEEDRLPFFLDHYRRLGIGHFLMVDNASTDGSTALLHRQPDVTVWRTAASYKAARFGVDWMNWLKTRYAHGHWVVVADIDELLIYPDWEARDLSQLTPWLDARGHRMMGALMLDMYPKGAPDAQTYLPGQDPMEVLQWFDAHGYWVQRQPKIDALWLQGGIRARKFFADRPERAPTLNKIPLVKWKRGYAFVNATHSGLPAALNQTWTTPVSGALLHTKFLPGTARRAQEEKHRAEHFQTADAYADYYDRLTDSPDLWDGSATRYLGWQQLLDLGLLMRGDW
ncbi:glycosyltransferase family 2 protein [Aliishimia ponticola]|uniref:glycosyltransferase family 2 protein n=1 Tax=Aliishimia ponticola TaxID=2499833 RepID=UPI001FE6C25D|nr:glycosyltransferase family 2 protein [Aliishimia ponticola]